MPVMSASGLVIVELTRKVASGTSSSGTAGTAVASITATVGRKLVGWSVFFGHAAVASTQARLTVTYTDDTTTTVDSSEGSLSIVNVNGGGGLTSAGVRTALEDKPVKSLAVTTLSTGTGARVANLAVIEVD